jgi:hypothetical protein
MADSQQQQHQAAVLAAACTSSLDNDHANASAALNSPSTSSTSLSASNSSHGQAQQQQQQPKDSRSRWIRIVVASIKAVLFLELAGMVAGPLIASKTRRRRSSSDSAEDSGSDLDPADVLMDYLTGRTSEPGLLLLLHLLLLLLLPLLLLRFMSGQLCCDDMHAVFVKRILLHPTSPHQPPGGNFCLLTNTSVWVPCCCCCCCLLCSGLAALQMLRNDQLSAAVDNLVTEDFAELGVNDRGREIRSIVDEIIQVGSRNTEHSCLQLHAV